MNKQKGLAPILIVLLIAAALGGYLVYSNYSNNYYKTNSGEQIVQSTPTPISKNESSSSAETANWETYTTEKYSFKYPADWTTENHCNGKAAYESEDAYVCFLSPDVKIGPVGLYGGIKEGGVFVVENQSGLVRHSSQDFCKSGPIASITECKQITIDKQPAWIRLVNSGILQAGIVKNGQFILSFSTHFTPQSKNAITQVFNQILSTFKFTQ